MSDDQARIQMKVFERLSPVTKEEAVDILCRIGVMNRDGSLTAAYSFLQPKKQ